MSEIVGGSEESHSKGIDLFQSWRWRVWWRIWWTDWGKSQVLLWWRDTSDIMKKRSLSDWSETTIVSRYKKISARDDQDDMKTTVWNRGTVVKELLTRHTSTLLRDKRVDLRNHNTQKKSSCAWEDVDQMRCCRKATYDDEQPQREGSEQLTGNDEHNRTTRNDCFDSKDLQQGIDIDFLFYQIEIFSPSLIIHAWPSKNYWSQIV